MAYEDGVSKWNFPARLWDYAGGWGTGRSETLTPGQREGKGSLVDRTLFAAPEGMYEGDRGPLMSDDPDYAKQQSVRGRITALGKTLGWDKDKIKNLSGPENWEIFSRMTPDEKGAKLEALATLANKMQEKVDRESPGSTALVHGRDMYKQLPDEDSGLIGPPHASIGYPPYAGDGSKRGGGDPNRDLVDRKPHEYVGPHGPLEAPRSQREYELKMERLKGILSPEELAQVQDEWKDQLLNPIDTTKDRRRMMFMTGLGKAFVSPASEGKYAVPGAVAALKLLNEGQEQGLDEFDRQEDAFHARTKNLQAGLDYDSKYAQTQKDLEHPTLYIDGKPINDAEFELLGAQSQELMAHLAGQATGNDPNVVGPMAERYASGQMTGNAKAQLQMAQAQKYAADAEIAKLREARAQDLAPLEKDKLEAQIAELEWQSREKQAAINAINAMLD